MTSKQNFNQGLRTRLVPMPFGGLRPRSSKDIEAERQERIDYFDRMIARAEHQQRDLSFTEKREFDQFIGKHCHCEQRDDPNCQCEIVRGEIADLDEELKAAKQYEEFQANKAITKSRMNKMNPSADNSLESQMARTYGNAPALPARPKVTKTTAFKDDETAYAAGMWLKAAFARSRGYQDEHAENHISQIGWNIYNAASEGSPTAGGYLVPTPLANSIIEYREEVGISRKLSTVMSMTADSLSIPKQTAGQPVYYPGEGNTITDTEETWGQITLNAKKRAILTKITNELLSDSVINLADHVASRIGFELAKQEDNEFINGDGTSTYGAEVGLLSAIGSAAVATADSGDSTWKLLDMADFNSCMAKLPSEHSMGAVWVCSSNFYHEAMLRVLAEAGGNTIASLGDGQNRPMFLGHPVYFTDQMPTTTAVSQVSALYGNFKNAVMIGDRVNVEIAISPDRYFEQDITAIRGIARYDINVHEAGDSSTVGAYAALKTSAS